MIDLVDGIIPSKDDLANNALMEESTRLFYVGMTRAKEHLELIWHKNRDGDQTFASPFEGSPHHEPAKSN